MEQNLLRACVEQCVALFETFHTEVIGSDKSCRCVNTDSLNEVETVEGLATVCL